MTTRDKFEKWTPGLRVDYGDLLAEIGAQLAGPSGAGIQRVIVDTMAIGYPSIASGSDSSPHNRTDEDGRPVQPDSATEAAALQPDRAALDAIQLAKDLTELGVLARRISPRLRNYDGGRAVDFCPLCLKPLDPRYVRCQDRACGSSVSGGEETCKNIHGCGVVLEPGKRVKGRCKPCADYLRLYGRDRVSAGALALSDAVLVAGVAHAGGES